jgi:hypothetical protein
MTTGLREARNDSLLRGVDVWSVTGDFAAEPLGVTSAPPSCPSTAASTELTSLLLTHIEDAVPVLQAAQANDATALAGPEAAWFAETHMDMMADTLTQGIIAQFPKSFHG